MIDTKDARVRAVGYGRGSADPPGRIFESARRLFFSEGFAGVTVDRLVREAGVSKSTLYKYFGDMPGVLRAVAEREADRFSFDDTEVPDGAGAFEDRLIATGTELLTLIGKPEKIQFDRLVLEQARSHPELAETYYKAIYARTQAHLASFLREGQSRGILRQDVSAQVLADQLLSMWLGLATTRAHLGLKGARKPSPEQRSREAVKTLLGVKQ